MSEQYEAESAVIFIVMEDVSGSCKYSTCEEYEEGSQHCHHHTQSFLLLLLHADRTERRQTIIPGNTVTEYVKIGAQVACV